MTWIESVLNMKTRQRPVGPATWYFGSGICSLVVLCMVTRILNDLGWSWMMKDGMPRSSKIIPNQFQPTDRKGNGRSTEKERPGSRCLERRSRRTGPGAMTREGLGKLWLEKTSKPRLKRFGSSIAPSIHGKARKTHEVALNVFKSISQANQNKCCRLCDFVRV